MLRRLTPKQQWVIKQLGVDKGYTEYGLTKLYLTEYPKFSPPPQSPVPSMYDQFNMHKTLTSLIKRGLVLTKQHGLVRHYYLAYLRSRYDKG